jgi:DNA-binding protein HU-beta
MNKSQFAEAIAEKSGLSKRDAQKALDGFQDALLEAMQNGEKVSLTGFGTFEVRERAARTGRNPQTGEEMEVAASKNAAFKPGKGFKDALNS